MLKYLKLKLTLYERLKSNELSFKNPNFKDPLEFKNIIVDISKNEHH